MANYHTTDNGPRVCSTTPDRCLYGRAGAEHFDNIGDAQTHYEKIMEKKYGDAGLAQAARGRRTLRYKLYSKLDQVQRDSEAHRKMAAVARYRRAAPSRSASAPYKPKGRSKGYDRMRKSHPGRRVAKIAARGGKQLFESAGPTPKNVIRLHGYLTKGLQDAVK